MLTLQGHFTELVSKRNEVSPVKSVLQCQLNHLLNRDLCKNVFCFHIFSFFLVFTHDFVIYTDFTYTTASNTETDDVTTKVTHRMFNTNL